MTEHTPQIPPSSVPDTIVPMHAEYPHGSVFSRFFRKLNPLVLVITIAAVILAAQWIDTRHRVNKLQEELAKRLVDAEGYNKESRILAAQSQEFTREAQVKLSVLESKLAESQNQQVALETLFKELSQNRDEWALAEIEQILVIASQQLQLAGNVQSALVALQTADNRLQRLDKPQFISLRKVLNKDIDRLKALPFVDTVGMSSRLDNLIASIDTLPLAVEERPQLEKTADKNKAEENLWYRLGREAWGDIKQMIRIQNMQRPDVPLLPPNQVFFLRENLKMRLLSARLALLAHDQTSFRDDLASAQDWLKRFYDTKAKPTAAALNSVRQLRESEVSIELPNLAASLDAIRTYKLSRERSGK